MKTHRIVILGSFPPPLHGASKNNAILAGKLEKKGMDVYRLDVAVPAISHARKGLYHFQRLMKNGFVNYELRKKAQNEAVFYMVPDGGAGIWYSLLHIQAAQKYYNLLILHHRTHKYIDKKSPVMERMTNIARDKTVHVFLTEGMASRFTSMYGNCRAFIASNARFIEPVDKSSLHIKNKKAALRLGYLSNLCREKGFYEVVDTFKYASKSGMNVTLDLAGPIIEPEIQTVIETLQINYGSKVRHWGFLKPYQKDLFFKHIDVFLFPTQYKLEAAPNVVYEALSASVPVIATDRGCIPDIVTGLRGVVIGRSNNYSEIAGKTLLSWSLEGDLEIGRKATILKSIKRERSKAKQQYDDLIDLMSSNSSAQSLPMIKE